MMRMSRDLNPEAALRATTVFQERPTTNYHTHPNILMHFRANYLLGNLHQLNSAIGMMRGAHVPRYVIAAGQPQSRGYKSLQGHLTSLLKPLRRV